MAYSQTQKITSPSAAVDGNFGSSVVVDDGSYAAVSQPSSTKVFLYRRNSDGVWESRISAGILKRGTSLAMHGNYLLIGDSTAGSVSVYNKNITSDTPLQTFTGAGADNYGASVDISEDYIVVGAPAADSNEGEAYVYEKTGTDSWTAYSGNPISATLGVANDYFGSAVATNNSSIIIGAYGNNSKKGTVYIFKKNDRTEVWEQEQQIYASKGYANDEFGAALSVSGEYLVVGAALQESDNEDVNAGAAYIFKFGTEWYEVNKLVGIDESNYSKNQFGKSVYISGEYIIIGSPFARSKGVADVFYGKRSWGHLKKIIGSDTAADDEFGSAVSISGRFIAVGSPKNDSAGSDSGAAYLYENPSIQLRLAQEFEVNQEYLPSKASVYLKRVGKNSNDYWSISNVEKTVIDATNFSTINKSENIIRFNDSLDGFTGNGYMISNINDPSNVGSFGVINYPLRAITSGTFDLWIRYNASDYSSLDILMDGEISKTINLESSNPSLESDWQWINTTLVLPDIVEHILGIKIKGNNIAIDKIYIEDTSSTPYGEGSDYTLSPYLTVHMKVYNSEKIDPSVSTVVTDEPNLPLYIYDYKNSISEVVQDDWYNFNIKVITDTEGYTRASDFDGNYFLVMAVTGYSSGNFVVWEFAESDEYLPSISAIKF